jgi:predicted amidophosphoribosyltransferase
MRHRHFPRLCYSCGAPMGRQEDSCWRCAIRWAPEHGPRTTLSLVAGTALAQPEDVPQPVIALAAADTARAASEASLDASRWTNEGGSFDPEAAPKVASMP